MSGNEDINDAEKHKRPKWLMSLFSIPGRKEDDIVSENAKIVLFGLFMLIGLAVLLYAITIANSKDASQGEKFNTVFIAAISGSIALGGTLITQIWGRDD
jgi:uncharacterized membrane protein